MGYVGLRPPIRIPNHVSWLLPKKCYLIWLKNYHRGVKYFVLFDDVRLLEKLKLVNGEEIIRKAFSEKVEGFPLERKLVLSGYPKVLQGRDVIKGNQVIIREENEIVEILNTNSKFYLEDEGRE